MNTGENKWGIAGHAAANLFKHAGRSPNEIPIEDGIPLFGWYCWGHVCEIFEVSSDAVIYHESIGTTQSGGTRSGRYGDYSWNNMDEVKNTFAATPFRSLPEMTKILDASFLVGDNWSMDVPCCIGGDPMKMTVTIQSDSETVSVPAGGRQ